MDSTLSMLKSLKGPDWRWQLAQKLAAEDSLKGDVISSLAVHQDSKHGTIQLAANYLRDQAAGWPYAELAAQYPLMVAALDLQLVPLRTEAIKLYVLANASRARIAKSCNVTIEIVRTWERLFFDVRPLLKMPAAIAAVTVDREIAAGRAELAAKMQLAIGGGVLAVEAIQRLAAGTLLSEADAVYQRELQLELLAKQALCIPLKSESARARFHEIYLNYLAETARIDFQRERLRTRSKLVMARREIQRLLAASERREGTVLNIEGDHANTAETISKASAATVEPN